MEFTYIILILIVLILFILILVWFIFNNDNSNNPYTPYPITPGNTSNPGTPINWQGPTGKTPVFTKFSEIVHDNPQVSNGKLFELCPCQNGYRCVKGLCRKDEGQKCYLNKECASGYCMMGTCVHKPPQIKDVDNYICLFGQIMMLNNDNTFELIDDWLNIVEVNNIVRNKDSANKYYITTEQHVYKIDGNKYSIQLVDDNIIFKQLFYFTKDLYGIGVDGFLYKIKDEYTEVWQAKIIINFQNYDFNNIEIIQAFPAYYTNSMVGNISFKIKHVHNQQELINYDINTDLWNHQKYNMVYYIDQWENRVEVYYNQVLFYYRNKVIDKLLLTQEYNDIIYTKNGLYLTNHQQVYYYKPNNKRSSPDLIYDTNNKNNRKSNNAGIKKIINTESQVWLILNNVCFTHH